MPGRVHRCEAFIIDVANRQFLHGERALAVEPKVFSVIAALLQKAGQLVTRDELLDAVWGHRFVTPSTLARCITLARRAFDDDANQPRFIQTVHGSGYRFIAAVEAGGEGAGEATPPMRGGRFGPPFALQLPERLEALVGRAGEVAELGRLIDEHRCVTVLGPGGIGKTQCALEAARQAAPAFPDGVWCFDLSSTDRATDWLLPLSAAFGIPPGEGEASLPAIAQVLRERHALLVLDNCEQYAEALAASVLKMLRATRHLVVLATSRRALDLPGEQRFPLAPMAVPEADPEEPPGDEDAGRLMRYEAVELLVRRVRALRPGFAPDARNAAALAGICRALDGIPLALELAAARFTLLSAEQVYGRLVERFRFLESGAIGLPARHRSLRNLLDWSWSLLSPAERRLLDWSACFAQSWSIEALVVVGEAQGLDEAAVVDLLAGLVGHSLVSLVPGATPARYRLLETVRAYALERLRGQGDETNARLAQLEAMARVYERAHHDMLRGRMREAVRQLSLDWANLDAAADTAASLPAGRPAGLRMLGALLLAVKAHGNYAGALRWCRRVLDGPAGIGGGVDDLALGRALVTVGTLQLHMYATPPVVPEALPRALRLLGESRDGWAEAYAHGFAAMAMANGDDATRWAEAAGHAERSGALARGLGDEVLLGLSCLARGWVFLAQDEPAAALEALDAAPREGGDLHQLHFIAMYRAFACFQLGRRTQAARHWLASIDPAAVLSHVRGIAGAIEGCAYLAGEAGRWQASARLLAASEAVRERAACPVFRFWRGPQAAALARLEAALPHEEREALREAGRQARQEEVVAETLALLRGWADGTD